jgi:hypothetical protein
MFHQTSFISVLILYLVSKAVILSVLLIYYLFSPEKGSDIHPGSRHIGRQQRNVTRLHLTLKNPRRQPGPALHRKTALQQTIEETFSSN